MAWLFRCARCHGCRAEWRWCARRERAALIEGTPKDIVVTVRLQGYPCEDPNHAVRAETASLPDGAVWILECANATYWIKYDNGLPAEIRELD